MEGRRVCEPTWILGLARPYSTCKGIRGNSPHACSASRKPALNDGHAVITTAEGTYGFYNSMSCCHFDVTSFCSPQSPHQNLTAAGHPLSPSFDISLPVFLSSSNDVVKCSTEPQALLLRGGGRPNASPEDALRVPGGMKSTAECCKMLADTYDAGVLHASTSLHLEIRDSGVPESFRNIGSFRTSTSAAEELYDLRDEPLVPQSSSSDKFRHCSEHDADLREGYDITGGFSHMIPSEPLLQAVEARGMDHFSAHTVVVADTHPELDSHMSGTRSPIHPETQEEAWSDIVLTRGQDPGSSVVGSAVVGTAKSSMRIMKVLLGSVRV
ncbi:hypothetical protein BESB_052340 [Besnoitia besnoiti]|uniref:Uncharacterized protein n=1 Tax=Besnoitia besnoiti TaxID=94643 RepID=A0A2A9MIW2_BESBE|nr:hypothetical protein BESB_052340 [Besnoitia besnoiti]PFH35583.1 hypothetical protein BESB_052340 [Besnoitia besnoiti]